MLKRLRDELSEKTKLIVYLAITAIVFVFSFLMPLAFSSGNDTAEQYFDTGERAAMFVAYNNKSKDVQVKVLDSFGNSDDKFCRSRAEKIISYCTLDKKAGKTITNGSEFLQVSDGENILRLYHTWLQNEGDWTNWIDIYFDADTGYVYYLYVSSVCLSNASDYAGALDSNFNCRSVADLIAEENASSLRHFSWSGNAEDPAYAVVSRNGDTVCWNINCSYYESTMLDVKISVA